MRGSGAFIQGIGNVKLSMVLALLDGVILRIGLSCLFGIVFNWGLTGIWTGLATGRIIASILNFTYARYTIGKLKTTLQ